jgi:DNA repair exonuclease SbcCD ATPase subunit
VIVFSKIRWQNLLSTGNQFTEIDLLNSGNTLIVGTNGAGKSTLLDALTFVLFGKSFRNINKPQLLNTITKRDLLVEIEFSIGKNNYLIRRGMKPNVFEVFCNDSLLNQSAEMRDYQEILEKQILKSNYKTFCQVDILGSASFIPFMQLPAAQRRAVIEDLLDLQVFSNMNVLLKEQVQQNNQDIIENAYKKKMIEEKIKFLNDHLDEIRRKSTAFIEEKRNTIELLTGNIKQEQEDQVADKELGLHRKPSTYVATWFLDWSRRKNCTSQERTLIIEKTPAAAYPA